MSDKSSSSSAHLEPPHKGVEVEDSGVQESASEEDHFSDASEGRSQENSLASSRAASPVPRTRVEKVDDQPRHGEVPGTLAYEKREQDAVPDEMEVVPEGSRSRSSSRVARPSTPGGTPIPRTMVVKVDETPSHGEVPGTEAYELRKADAVPDTVVKTPGDQTPSTLQREYSEQSVPETLLSRVDTLPKDPTSPRLRAHSRSPSDALPDSIETIEDTSGDDDFGDDFDEFEEGENGEAAGDDFGDFDEGFEGPAEGVLEDPSKVSTQHPASPLLPLPEFNAMPSISDLLSATEDSLDTLFPETKEISSLPPLEPISDHSAIFSSERSLSLWSQLVAPPPLQPPNWVKSRIRRLFLVSLGVPVDLDEILPASKQKKLILPSINLEGSGASAYDLSKTLNRSKNNDGTGPQNDSTLSLDLSAVRRLCSTTDAALDGFTDTELQGHVVLLETTTTKADEVLQYWCKKTDGLISEKEAFEGVIENLVNHARRVRK
ncbi:hypothetical protein BGW36DRAFT_373837 [Talaromyces proteolyticus]|uniref:Uncharacterized protein n=1 Tax=Talaromyces proteolyticus TaxID=1131652 RepID=A0AAD4KZU2_9EURO|nr:uncharacterized protein BGW36DRAFT_373837 [Talaromyces proteolyticus]KAH8700304.1 hypothetical protein BGW36DRAFT_373837 [Talaromyces proteolyticus]